jgi:hypothetical protein
LESVRRGRATGRVIPQGFEPAAERLRPLGEQPRKGGRCEPRLTSGLRKPIMVPCGILTQVATRLGTSAGAQLRFFQCTRWRSKRGNLGFPDDPQACRRGIAPKNIATFNSHTEAREPMAGAFFTRYDAPSYARGWRQ